MTFGFISELSESRLFPTKKSIDRWKSDESKELLYLYLLILIIFLETDEYKKFAKDYIEKVYKTRKFDRWRTDGNDLFVLLHILDDDLTRTFKQRLLDFFFRAGSGQSRDTHQNKLLVNLDSDLRMKNESMRSIRRLVKNWDKTTTNQRKNAVVRLLNNLRHSAHRSELYDPLKDYVRKMRMEIMEDDESDNFIMGLEKKSFKENATTGATSAASIATLPGAIGAGFDPDGDYGVYPKPKKDKMVILRRVPPVSENKEETLFMKGGCFALAKHLHEKTGLPLYGLVDDSGYIHHAFVKKDDFGIDIRGKVPLDRIHIFKGRESAGKEIKPISMNELEKNIKLTDPVSTRKLNTAFNSLKDVLNEGKTPWLRVTDTNLAVAKDNKCQIIVQIPCEVFLEMTTAGSIEDIKSKAQPLKTYNRATKMGHDEDFKKRVNDRLKKSQGDDYEKEYGSIIMPMLKIQLSDDGSTGVIKDHEGRHRAAALIDAGQEYIPVALCLKPGEKMFGKEYLLRSEHIPKTVEGQFNGRIFSTASWKIEKELFS